MSDVQMKDGENITTCYSELDKTQLDLLFHPQNWSGLSKEQRLSAVQEVAIRQALEDGRPAIRIKADDAMDAGLLGAFCPGLQIIKINARYLEGSKLGQFSGINALATVTHEGRHAFQYFVAENQSDKVPEMQKLEWLADFLGYESGGNGKFYYYAIQSIEMDARRCARRRLEKLCETYRKAGLSAFPAELSLHNARMRECDIIEKIRAEMNLEEIDALEQKRKQVLKERFPEMDLSDFHPYDSVRYILEHPKLYWKDVLDRLDKMADKKLGLDEDRAMKLREAYRDLGLRDGLSFMG